MYSQFKDDKLLGAEAAVFLDVDDSIEDAQEWGVDPDDALDVAELEAWTRHAARAAGFATAGADDDGEDFGSEALTAAVRRVMDMSWD